MRGRRQVGAGLIAACAGSLAISAAAGDPPKIPLRLGLLIVTAVADSRGDYESVKEITGIDERMVTIHYKADLPDAEDSPVASLLGMRCEEGSTPGRRVADSTRDVRREDLESGREYRYIYQCGEHELFPGSTAVGVSATVLRELRTKGRARIGVVGAPDLGTAGAKTSGGGPPSILDALTASGAPAIKIGDVVRLEPADVPFKTIVNDQPTELPALHARARLGDVDTEFWFLDDDANALSLRWSIGGQRLQVIKLAFPPEPTAAAAPNPIEQQLATACRAVVYGIYFDFARDAITPESDPVLSEIATALQHNPTWSLTVEGHTDSIGGDVYNLDLSKRRASAVKQALTIRYRIAASRLTTDGFGASRPKDTNATLEGRARNRRVELTRGC